MSNKTPKFFVVATEGATTDGRTISREWLTQAAENYDPVNKLGARINVEHIAFRMLWANEPHSQAYGDVLALKTEERADGKLQLLAQLDPTETMRTLIGNRQKVYTSIELDLDFGGSGQAYLVGLALTDTPASMGTEMLKFCAGAPYNALNEFKARPENLFAESVELNVSELNFSAAEETVYSAEPNAEAEPASVLAQVEQALHLSQNEEPKADIEQALILLANQFAQFKAESAQQAQRLAHLEAQFAQLDNEPSTHYQRAPVSTGSQADSQYLADC